MKKRFQVRKFVGEEYAVVDVLVNATVGVHPTKDHARSFANHRCAAMLKMGTR